jgi:hypothetical protein
VQKFFAASASAGLLASALPATAQQAPASPGEDSEIVVSIARQSGRVIGDIPPEIQLNAQDIRAIGAASIADLIQELGPQTRSGRGRGNDAPVVLINGKRVSGFAEIRNLPPEALQRVEVLPEEVALKYGYRADQRVINFVLRERFRAVVADIDLGGPTAGGRTSAQGETSFLRIRKGTRLSLEAEYKFDSRLLESDRSIVQSPLARPYDLVGNVTSAVAGAPIDPRLNALAAAVVTVAAVPATAASTAPGLAAFVPAANTPNVTSTAPYRSLLPENRALTLGATYAGTIGKDTGATLTTGLVTGATRGLNGLPTAILVVPAGNPFSPFADPVLVDRYAPTARERTTDSWTGRIGTAINGNGKGWISAWQWSLVANYSHGETETRTDRGIDLSAVQARLSSDDPSLNPFGASALAGPLQQDRAVSNTDNADASLVVNGGLLALPAGGLSVSFKAGGQALSLQSESQRAAIFLRNSLSRTQGNFQGSFDLPLTSVKNDVLPALGALSANFNIAVDTLSDFGSLLTYGYGLAWKPVEGIEFIASTTDERGAPTIQQLGDPLLVTPNVRVFDFVRGETVDISRIDGGNKALIADHRKVRKIGLTVRPVRDTDLTLTANFIDSRTDNPIAAFPTATAELEAAFPDRFRRDADGRLLQIDNRPVNFAKAERQELRWGFNFSQPLPASKAEIAAAAARRAALEARRAAGGGAEVTPPVARPPAGSGGPGGGNPGGGGFRGLDGRFQLSVFHTWRFKDQIVIRDGVPLLDLLGGSATGNRGGQPQHLLEARAGIGKSGLGARFGLNWQSATRVLVDPSGATVSPGDLVFSGLATVNLRLFADLGQRPDIVKRAPFFRGARISLAIENLTDAKINVRDRAGAVPIGYQRDLIDPLGRTVTFSFRKLFS